MKKLIFAIAIIPMLALISCDKGDIEIRKMNRGEGTWTIESVTYEYYDSTGAHVDSTQTIDKPGELIFFKEGTLNELYDEHFLIVDIFDASGNVTAYTGGAYYDDARCKISTDAGTVADGVWTIVDNGRKKQEWAQYALTTGGTLYEKVTMKIKKK